MRQAATASSRFLFVASFVIWSLIIAFDLLTAAVFMLFLVTT